MTQSATDVALPRLRWNGMLVSIKAKTSELQPNTGSSVEGSGSAREHIHESRLCCRSFLVVNVFVVVVVVVTHWLYERRCRLKISTTSITPVEENTKQSSSRNT